MTLALYFFPIPSDSLKVRVIMQGAALEHHHCGTCKTFSLVIHVYRHGECTGMEKACNRFQTHRCGVACAGGQSHFSISKMYDATQRLWHGAQNTSTLFYCMQPFFWVKPASAMAHGICPTTLWRPQLAGQAQSKQCHGSSCCCVLMHKTSLNLT